MPRRAQHKNVAFKSPCRADGGLPHQPQRCVQRGRRPRRGGGARAQWPLLQRGVPPRRDPQAKRRCKRKTRPEHASQECQRTIAATRDRAQRGRPRWSALCYDFAEGRTSLCGALCRVSSASGDSSLRASQARNTHQKIRWRPRRPTPPPSSRATRVSARRSPARRRRAQTRPRAGFPLSRVGKGARGRRRRRRARRRSRGTCRRRRARGWT